jgi:hypothetical protein
MVPLHPSFLEYDGKKAFVVLPYDEFQALEEEIETLQDIEALRVAKAEEGDAPTVSHEDVKRLFGL